MSDSIWRFQNKARRLIIESNDLIFLLYELGTFYGILNVPVENLVTDRCCKFTVQTDDGLIEEVNIIEVTQ